MEKIKLKTGLILSCILMVCILAFYSCSQKEESGKTASAVKPPAPVAKKEPALVQIGTETITAEHLKTHFTKKRGPAPSKETAAQYIDKRVVEALLYQEGLRLKLDQEPRIQRSIRRMISQKLIEDQINRPVMNLKFTDDQLNAYFETHRHEFNRPEQVRVADIFIAGSSDGPPEQRQAAKEKAKTVLAQALKKQKQRNGFSGLMRKHSDKHPLYAKGDTGYFDPEGKPQGLDAALVQASFGLEKNGLVHDQVIETQAGFHIIMRIGKRAAVKKELAKIKRVIERRMRQEALDKALAAYIDKLKTQAGVKIDNQALTVLVKELEAADKAEVIAQTTPVPKVKTKAAGVPPALPGKSN